MIHQTKIQPGVLFIELLAAAEESFKNCAASDP